MEIGGSRYVSSLVAAQSQTNAANHARRPQVGFQDPEEDSGTPFAKSRPEPTKVGFGSDSVKLPGVTVTTIRRNVRQAEKLIPTLEESEARVRDRVEEDKRRLSELKRRPPQSLNLLGSQESAVNSARTFISSVNAAAGEARFRTGAAEQPPTNRLDIRIGAAYVPLDKPESRPPLDLLA